MANSDEGFPDVGDEVFFGVFGQFLVDDGHLFVEEDVGDHCQGEGVLYVFNGLVVPFHADVGQ